MENINLLHDIVKAKVKIIVLLELVLKDPKVHIKNLTQYKQVKKLVKTLNDENLNNEWSNVSRKLYNYLYDKEYSLRKKKEGMLNGSNTNKALNITN
ncbi:hypothetical protein [Clostridium perfringens]|uniref:hypothetical protein n=1 Tax=Clostridium perfringens TaxID=1502 RepID=UPI0032DAD395